MLGIFKKIFTFPFYSRNKPVLLTLGISFLNRAWLFAFVYLGLRFFPSREVYDLLEKSPGLKPFLDGFLRWDSGWYVHIVKNGYEYIEGSYCNVAFFPLYPLIVKLADNIICSPAVSAIIISNACFLLGMIMLYRLAEKKFNDACALKTVILFSLFPFSFFFSAAYSESLFLLLAICSFYFAEEKKWAAASLCAMFASAARVTGVFLLPALLLRYLEEIDFDFRKIKPDIAYIAIIPLGLLSFMFFLNYKFGDPLLFLKVQSVWERQLFSFNHHMYAFKRVLTDYKGNLYFFYMVLTLLFTGSLWPVARRLGFSYAVFSFFMIFIPFVAGLEGMGRFLSTVFPSFMAACSIRNKYLFFALCAISTLLLMIFSFIFSHWGWMT